jgi:hypothetical protein
MLGLVALAGASNFAAAVVAEDLYLAEANVFPGRLLVSEGGTAERVVHRRQPRPDRAYPSAVMKLQHIAVGPDGKVYYCSGLDGSLMHLLDGRNEIQSFEFSGQIRDLACTGEEHTVYFSVVPTPQNSEPLADGKIYRRDFWDGSATEVATVRQADVGGNWWGAFAIHDGVIYVATLDERSRFFKLTGDGPQPVFADNAFRVTGFTPGAGGEFFFTTGDGNVYRTSDFASADAVLRTDRRLSDVSVRAASESPRP